MQMKSRAALAALGAALGAALTVSPLAIGSAQAQTRHPPTRVGVLTCNVSGGVGAYHHVGKGALLHLRAAAGWAP